MADAETLNGMLGAVVTDRGQLLIDTDTNTEGDQLAEVESIGKYYKATDEAALPTGVTAPTGADWGQGHLDAYDEVIVDGAKGVEIVALTATVDVGGTPTEVTRYARVENVLEGDNGTVTYYQPVDIIADWSLTDDGDADPNPEDLHPVTAEIPMATEYSHIHFGLWASLNEDGDAIADLGIGFVQNHDLSGPTEKQGFGSATFNGDWVAAVRRQYASDAEAGAITRHDGKAMMTANFEDSKFEAVLTGLATLKGTLTGNGFSGMTATDITHEDLDADRKFEGEFSGNIYGPTGMEAAGVFDFDGDEAGAFRGAFGGTQKD